MGIESGHFNKTERTFIPSFDVRVHRDDAPLTHKTVTLSYGGVTFEAKANLVNYVPLEEVRLSSSERDIAPDEVARLKVAAQHAFVKYIEAEKEKDYQENFR